MLCILVYDSIHMLFMRRDVPEAFREPTIESNSKDSMLKSL